MTLDVASATLNVKVRFYQIANCACLSNLLITFGSNIFTNFCLLSLVDFYDIGNHSTTESQRTIFTDDGPAH